MAPAEGRGLRRPQLGYKDKAWSVNRLSLVARRHGCYEACHRLINSLYGYNAMEVQEAFAKIRQQVPPPPPPPAGSPLPSKLGPKLARIIFVLTVIAHMYVSKVSRHSNSTLSCS